MRGAGRVVATSLLSAFPHRGGSHLTSDFIYELRKRVLQKRVTVSLLKADGGRAVKWCFGTPFSCCAPLERRGDRGDAMLLSFCERGAFNPKRKAAI